LDIASTSNSSRFVETLTWVAGVAAGIAVINALFTTRRPIQWQLKVPNLFFQVLRSMVVLAIAYYIISNVWGVNITQFVTAVGVGSLAIALALQNTLGNLVSGLLLLIAKPFKRDDWIEIEGTEARVAEQNWWSVTLEEQFWDYRITIPNGALAGATIRNYGPQGIWRRVSVSLSYDDPPNQVIPILEAIVDDLETVLAPGRATIREYEESSIGYDLWYKVQPEDIWPIGKLLRSRIYYTMERHGFTIPYPIGIEYAFDLDPRKGVPGKYIKFSHDRHPEITTHLRSSPYFLSLDQAGLDALAECAMFKTYGTGEVIVQEGKSDEGVYLVVKGRVRLWTQNKDGYPQAIEQLVQGEVFGEMALFPGEVSPITAIAEEDTTLVIIVTEGMIKAIQNYSKFGINMTRLIEEGKRSLNAIKGIR
ncbi:MAG: mechanosensitive ion channel, partial [Symploca sp. SIO2B6]|nr:mechanosensitive ion channel [Symploca sp. SIO2B6]